MLGTRNGSETLLCVSGNAACGIFMWLLRTHSISAESELTYEVFILVSEVSCGHSFAIVKLRLKRHRPSHSTVTKKVEFDLL